MFIFNNSGDLYVNYFMSLKFSFGSLLASVTNHYYKTDGFKITQIYSPSFGKTDIQKQLHRTESNV